jgi:hypothetical protein
MTGDESSSLGGGARKPFRRKRGEEAIRHAAENTEKPRIWAGNGDLAAATHEALCALMLKEQIAPSIFRYGGSLVRIELDEEGRARPVLFTEYRARHELADRADYFKLPIKDAVISDRGDGTEALRDAERRAARDNKRAHPPMAVVRNLLAMPSPPFAVLRGFVGAPVFANGCELINGLGYDNVTGLYLDWPADLKIPSVPKEPSSADKARARALIIDEVLGDFPFVSDADRANAAATLLERFALPLIGWRTPLRLFDKPSPGSGATLLVDVIARVVTGRPARIMTQGRDDEELRKRITSQLMAGAAVLCIDNIRGKLDSASLSAAITADVWEDRVMGRSEIASLPVRCTWIATGNNIQTSNEIARRSVHVRLDPKSERPWQRDGFRHPRIVAWVDGHRAELIWAALVFFRSWISAGRPKGPARAPLGMFEQWADVMGDVLHHNGVDGFLENASDFYEKADSEASELQRLLLSWWQTHADARVGSAQLVGLADSLDPPMDLGRGDEQSRKIVLGRRIRSLVDKRITSPTTDGQQLTLAVRDGGQKGNSQLWKLAIVKEGE